MRRNEARVISILKYIDIMRQVVEGRLELLEHFEKRKGVELTPDERWLVHCNKTALSYLTAAVNKLEAYELRIDDDAK